MNLKFAWPLSRRCLALPLLVLISSNAFAEPSVHQQLLACASIADADERLGCFDSYTARYVDEVQDTKEARPTQPNDPATQNDLDKTHSEAFADNPSESNFGFTPEKKITAIGAKVLGVQQRLANSLFILDNQQQWRQTDGRKHRIREGHEVVIEEGALGAFYLKKPSAKRRVRVQRVE